MPGGKVHFVSNVAFGIGLSYAVYVYIPEALPFAISGLVIGTLITPDYDLEVTTYTEKIIKGIPVLGWLFLIGSYAYALLFRHRGSSHGFITGTLSRIVWLLLFSLFWIAFFSGLIFTIGIVSDYVFYTDIVNRFYDACINVVENADFDFLVNNIAGIGIIAISWYLQDWNHYILDYFVSDHKRRRRSRWS